MFTIKFPNVDGQYVVPIECLEKHNKSFFAGIYHFKQQSACTITTHTYEELAIVVKALNSEPIDLKTYIENRKILDYYGIANNTYDRIRHKLLDDKKIAINWFNDFINNPNEQIIFSDTMDQYFSYKMIFEKESNIVPFQLLVHKRMYGEKYMALLTYNGFPTMSEL